MSVLVVLGRRGDPIEIDVLHDPAVLAWMVLSRKSDEFTAVPSKGVVAHYKGA